MIATTPESGSIVSMILLCSHRPRVAVRNKVRLMGAQVGHLILCDLSVRLCAFGPALKGEPYTGTLDSCFVNLVVFHLNPSLLTVWWSKISLILIRFVDKPTTEKSILFRLYSSSDSSNRQVLSSAMLVNWIVISVKIWKQCRMDPVWLLPCM